MIYLSRKTRFVFQRKSFEEIEISKDLISGVEYLQNDMIVKVCFCNERIISVSLPEHVILTIETTQPVTKGQTASSSYKPATLSNGSSTNVPQHIDSGD